MSDHQPPAADPAADTAPASPERTDRLLLRIGVAASTVGLCLLLFAGYLFLFTGLQEARHQHFLLNTFETPAKTSILSGRVPASGQPAAVLEIPALHLEQVVVQGTTATDLLQGPGVMPGTARPGSLGNAVIAGRRSTAGQPFADLGELRPGDRIVVVTGLGRFRYRVFHVGTVVAGQPDPISPSRHPRLTLVTSNALLPTGREYAVARLVSAPVRVPVPRQPPSVAERGLSGDPDAVLPTVGWGLVLALAFAATFWSYGRWRDRWWTVYLLSTPIVLALALVWYGNLIRLLPATM